MTLVPPTEAERIAAAVRRVVDAAPPLSDAQAAQLRAASVPISGRRHREDDGDQLGEAA